MYLSSIRFYYILFPYLLSLLKSYFPFLPLLFPLILPPASSPIAPQNDPHSPSFFLCLCCVFLSLSFYPSEDEEKEESEGLFEVGIYPKTSGHTWRANWWCCSRVVLTHTQRPPLIFSQTLSPTVFHTRFYSHFKAPWLQGSERLNTVYLQLYWLIGFLSTHTHALQETHAREHKRKACTRKKVWWQYVLELNDPLPATRDKFVLCSVCICACVHVYPCLCVTSHSSEVPVCISPLPLHHESPDRAKYTNVYSFVCHLHIIKVKMVTRIKPQTITTFQNWIWESHIHGPHWQKRVNGIFSKQHSHTLHKI